MFLKLVVCGGKGNALAAEPTKQATKNVRLTPNAKNAIYSDVVHLDFNTNIQTRKEIQCIEAV